MEMRFVFERVIAYRSAVWQRRPPAATSAAAATYTTTSTSSADADGSGAGNGGAGKLPGSACSKPAEPAELKTAMAAWRAGFARLNGRPPTKSEATAMVMGLVSTLADSEEDDDE